MPEHLIAAGRMIEPEGVRSGTQRLAQMSHTRGRGRQRATRLRWGLQSLCAEPMCSMSREPLREAYTICTARAPEAVFTVPM